MAEAAKYSDTIECGFCLRSNEELEEPKILPCSHVSCLECLSASYISNSIECPQPDCRFVIYQYMLVIQCSPVQALFIQTGDYGPC